MNILRIIYSSVLVAVIVTAICEFSKKNRFVEQLRWFNPVFNIFYNLLSNLILGIYTSDMKATSSVLSRNIKPYTAFLYFYWIFFITGITKHTTTINHFLLQTRERRTFLTAMFLCPYRHYSSCANLHTVILTISFINFMTTYYTLLCSITVFTMSLMSTWWYYYTVYNKFH